jgi:hypothetical protein
MDRRSRRTQAQLPTECRSPREADSGEIGRPRACARPFVERRSGCESRARAPTCCSGLFPSDGSRKAGIVADHRVRDRRPPLRFHGSLPRVDWPLVAGLAARAFSEPCCTRVVLLVNPGAFSRPDGSATGGSPRSRACAGSPPARGRLRWHRGVGRSAGHSRVGRARVVPSWAATLFSGGRPVSHSGRRGWECAGIGRPSRDPGHPARAVVDRRWPGRSGGAGG